VLARGGHFRVPPNPNCVTNAFRRRLVRLACLGCRNYKQGDDSSHGKYKRTKDCVYFCHGFNIAMSAWQVMPRRTGGTNKSNKKPCNPRYALGNTLSQIVEVFNFHLQLKISEGGCLFVSKSQRQIL